jgi:hypothetical protein
VICTDLLLRDHKNSLTVREIVFFFNKELTDKLMGVKKKVEKKKSIALFNVSGMFLAILLHQYGHKFKSMRRYETVFAPHAESFHTSLHG